MSAPIAVVGIGADGWAGLGEAAKRAITEAEVLMGSARQLHLVPASPATRLPWPAPLLPALPKLLDAHRDHRVAILASGDPMFHGIGVTLANLLGADRLRVIPAPSSASLACARLGWALHRTPVVSLVARPLETVLPDVHDGARLLVLSSDGGTPAGLAKLLHDKGFGPTGLTLLEQLGGPRERRSTGTAASWAHPGADPLNVVALECRADPTTPRLTRQPGLPDAAYRGDGQLTKQEVRSLSLAALAPAPGELLWDVGGGSGSIAIEWSRTHPDCRAITFEHDQTRAAQIAVNARALGVPTVAVRGRAPDAFEGTPDPDAVFVGGGVTTPGLLDACWNRLRAGGRLVANAVTLESEALLVTWAARHGGSLRRIEIQRTEPLGGFTAWRPHRTVVQLCTVQSAGHDGARDPVAGGRLHVTDEEEP